MCGIFAVVDFAGPLPSEESQLRAIDLLGHRGPDCVQVVQHGSGMVGAARLAITGNLHSDQPLQAGPLTVALNGEIYNYRQLREELQAEGAPFRGDGDTEVVLQAFRHWGRSALARFDGMFAIAAWDASTDTLTLARDRFGEKPLSYSCTGFSVRAASEVQVLVEALDVSGELDLAAVLDLSTHWYIDTPRSIYARIQQVPPGHALVFDRRGMKLADWRVPDKSAAPPLDCVRAIDEALRSSMDSRTPTSERSGILLSSGIDSGLLASYAAELQRDVLAISTSFLDKDFDESEAAARVARSLGIPHVVVPVDLSSFDLPQRVYGHLDEPLADASVLAAFAAAEASASEGLRVVLSGDGGDELFGGYPTYSADLLTRRMPRLPGSAERALLALSPLIPEGHHPIGRRYRFQQFAGALHLDAPAAHSAWRAVSNADERRNIFSPIAQALASYDPFARSRMVFAAAQSLPWLDRMLAIDQGTWLPGDHLRKTDRAFMAFGVETRAPFLADAVRRVAAGLPVQRKAGLFATKKALRSLAYTRLPQDVASMPKRGWTAPTNHLMRSRQTETWDLLTSGLASQVASRPVVEATWRNFLSGEDGHGRLLWSLTSLSLWGHAHRWSLP